jgi:hypothetical protein
MTDRERYGMVGLVARLTQGHPDYEPLMNGFDLTKLGVAVDSNEYASYRQPKAGTLLTMLQASNKYLARPIRRGRLRHTRLHTPARIHCQQCPTTSKQDGRLQRRNPHHDLLSVPT